MQRLNSVIQNANLSNKLVTVNDLILDELNSIEVISKYLTTLVLSPLCTLMGLLGTIISMIEIFGAGIYRMADPSQLAHGISVALFCIWNYRRNTKPCIL